MMALLFDLASEFWAVTAEMAPYLLLGFGVAGVLSAFISPALVERHLGGRGPWPVVKAALFGVPLPLCSCGVIPVGASLRQHGANRGATTSFLLSTPQTGVDSILVTYSMLGPVFAVFRPLAAMITGVLGGWLVAASDRKGLGLSSSEAASTAGCDEGCDPDFERAQGVLGALRYGFVSLPRDIGKSLVVGLVIAAGIGVFVPPDFAGSLGTGFVGMLAMMAVGIPLYVCATGSVPIAAALMLKGISPGAALVFLMTGPATNAAAISTIWKILGRRTALIYLGVVAGFALLSGWALDAIFDAASLPAHAMHAHEMGPGPVEHISAILLVAILAWALVGARLVPTKAENPMTGKRAWRLSIQGMNCGHCVASVERALRETAGVTSVEVSLEGKSALVEADALDEALVQKKIEQLGFTLEGMEPA